MWLQVKENLLAPVARRLGTNAGALLVGFGASHDVASSAALVVTWAALSAVDLLWSKINRDKVHQNGQLAVLREKWATSL